MVWVPCAIWLAYQGYWASAVFLVIFGAAVIGTMDNLIRTYILHTDVKLHPLLAFISVLGGVQAMGLWGIFIAPIVASCLHALILIVNSELKELSKDQYKAIKDSFDRDDDEDDDQPTEKPEDTKGGSDDAAAVTDEDSKLDEKHEKQSGTKKKRTRRQSRKRSGKRR